MDLKICMDYLLLIFFQISDTSLIHSNLTKVLSSVATRDLRYCLDMPESVSKRIFSDCGNDGEQKREQRIHYYIICSPYALLGWSHVAGQLHYWGEETAARAAKYYVQRVPGTCGCGFWNVENAYYHVYTTHEQIHAFREVYTLCTD